MTLLNFTPLNAQNLGAYYSPFDKQQLDKNIVDKWTGSADLIEAFLSNEKYPDLSLEQKYERTSLGGKHYTFQVYYKGLAIEQVFIKILVDKSQDIRLIQSNLQALHSRHRCAHCTYAPSRFRFLTLAVAAIPRSPGHGPP